YTGNRYNFSFGSSSGREGKQKVVDKYPPGSDAVCYVNPRRPEQAVISRAMPGDIWFGVIPVVFLLVGVGGMIAARRAARRRLQLRDA
ncbi:DUF3592 domain-containing protein, partial [Salmonella enterica]|uniref:DUF3592 domain-containing protein n=1 Tax=Salmonella enterica TaxID=28901 RepID=UPI003CF7CB30